MFALIDCNNFYVSCERAFQPFLQHKAGVVLSNNDGCAIARSQEAKDFGIKMGMPYFELQKSGLPVWVRSSNYPLYQDMMYRVTSIIRNYFPDQEIYSIDECFCDLKGYDYLEPIDLAKRLREEILQCTGIPVCIGIAKSKTLAKIANRLAKKQKDIGVYILDSKESEHDALKQTEIGDVWGIGRQYASRLQAMNIRTAYEFSVLPSDWVLKEMTIVGLRMWRELNGESCVPMEYIREKKKRIGTSRSFGRAEESLDLMLEALSTYISHAASKLRKQESVCGKILVYAHTSRFVEQNKQISVGLELKIPTPTASTSELVKIGKWILRKTFRKGYRYAKVGVELSDIRPNTEVQQSLFDKSAAQREKMSKLFAVVDKINNREGRETVRLAGSGFEKAWTMKQDFLSKRYTTSIMDIIEVRAR